MVVIICTLIINLTPESINDQIHALKLQRPHGQPRTFAHYNGDLTCNRDEAKVNFPSLESPTVPLQICSAHLVDDHLDEKRV